MSPSGPHVVIDDCLSGFIFGYIYGGRDGFHRLEWWDFMCKRLAGLYPLYLASILLGEYVELRSRHETRWRLG